MSLPSCVARYLRLLSSTATNSFPQWFFLTTLNGCQVSHNFLATSYDSPFFQICTLTNILENIVCDLKHDPSLKKRQHFSMWATCLKFVSQKCICLHSRLKQFHCPIRNTFVRTKFFVWLFLSHNDNICMKQIRFGKIWLIQ
jgi:hypothetical protein